MTKLSEIKPGDILKADDGFDCLSNGQEVMVKRANDGLYVQCSEGRHYLVGQLTANGDLVGLSK